MSDLLTTLASHRGRPVTDADLDGLLEAVDSVDPGSASLLRSGFAAVAARALEARLLMDPELRELARYWDARVGEAPDIIAGILNSKFGSAPSELVSYLRRCIRSTMSRYGEPEEVGRPVLEAVLEKSLNSRRQPRCGLCGYHFTREDTGADRLQILVDLGAVFARGIHPGRLNDPVKPWQISTASGRTVRLTNLSIDHETPESGFGWSDIDNLMVTCRYCNHGKGIYRYPLEAISTVIAGSMFLAPESRPFSNVRQFAAVAGFREYGSCSRCGSDSSSIELTANALSETRKTKWFVPVREMIVCYECLA